MRIWHQSLTVLDDLPSYVSRLRRHIADTVRPDTEVVLHGMRPGTYPEDYPGNDLRYAFLFSLHALQFPLAALNAEAQGFDAFVSCTLPDPGLREARSIVNIPVVGCGEQCFIHAAPARRFGILIFNTHMAPRYREQLERYGLSDRCVGIDSVGFGFADVIAALDNPGKVIDLFSEAARMLIAKGAELIIPGEIPMNVLLATERVNRIDDIPLLDSLGLTLKMAETSVDFYRGGLFPTRTGWANAMPPRNRVHDVLAFYGLSRFIDNGERS